MGGAAAGVDPGVLCGPARPQLDREAALQRQLAALARAAVQVRVGSLRLCSAGAFGLGALSGDASCLPGDALCRYLGSAGWVPVVGGIQVHTQFDSAWTRGCMFLSICTPQVWL